jgi:hypothetical protein
VLNQVLGGGSDSLHILRSAQHALAPGGCLMIIDRIQPAARHLEQDRPEGLLLENQLTAQLGELGYRVFNRTWFPGRIMEYALFSARPQVASLRTGTND